MDFRCYLEDAQGVEYQVNVSVSIEPAQDGGRTDPSWDASWTVESIHTINGLNISDTISGAIEWGQARIVRHNDVFELNAINEAPTHKYNAFASTEQRGAIVGAYVVVKTQSGDYLTHTMNVESIDAIMLRSESVKSGKASPWKTDYEEMAKKTVVKQAHKYWPRRERLDAAIHYMDTDGGEGVVEKDVTPQYDHAARLDWVQRVKSPSHVETAVNTCKSEGATEEQIAEIRKAGEMALQKIAESQNG